MKKASIKEYQRGNISGFTRFLASYFKVDYDFLKAVLYRQFPQLHDHSKCPNCGASMEIRIFSASIHDALVVLKLGEVVYASLRRGVPFKEANKVHVPTLATSDAVRHRVTITSYLGLVEQPREWRKTGYWRLTQQGVDALRGAPVYKTASYFRGKLSEYGTEKTTLSEMFKAHDEKVQESIRRGKEVAADYRADVSGYKPIDWATIGGYAQGELL